MAGERKLPLHVWLYGPSHRIHTRNNKNMHTSETKTRTFNLDGALSSLYLHAVKRCVASANGRSTQAEA